MSTFTAFIQHSFGSLCHGNKRRKGNKRHPYWKGRFPNWKSSADELILYVESPKDVTRKLLELINEFSKVAGYKINTQKSLTFLYTNNERS